MKEELGPQARTWLACGFNKVVLTNKLEQNDKKKKRAERKKNEPAILPLTELVTAREWGPNPYCIPRSHHRRRKPLVLRKMSSHNATVVPFLGAFVTWQLFRLSTSRSFSGWCVRADDELWKNFLPIFPCHDRVDTSTWARPDLPPRNTVHDLKIPLRMHGESGAVTVRTP